MTDLVTTRWRKFGKDRLYVKTAAGLDVGYIDLLSGAVEVQVAEFDAEVRALAPKPGPANASRGVPAAMVSAAEPTSPASEHRAAEIPRSLSESVPPLAVAPLGYDLTDNRAGAAANAKRQEVNGEAPVWNLVARAFGVKNAERAWRVGAKGEEMLGHELAKLPDGWHVLHAVPVGVRGSDIDHVVVGPSGVFTLNTKRHPDGKVCVSEGGVRVNRYSTRYLHISRFEAKRATKLLTAACAMQVDVQAAIVFVGLAELTRKGTPPDVHVVTGRTLRAFLTQQPQRLTPSQVEHIYTVARNSLTWQPA